MEPEPAITPAEVRGIFFVIIDMAEDVEKIKKLVEEAGGQDPEDDA